MVCITLLIQFPAVLVLMNLKTRLPIMVGIAMFQILNCVLLINFMFMKERKLSLILQTVADHVLGQQILIVKNAFK